MPAVTIVAAWINAETGVGPSIASGSQVWRNSWADLPIAPINKKKHAVFKTLKSMLKIEKVFDDNCSFIEKIVSKSRELV